MWSTVFADEDFNIRDAVYGVVKYCCRRGTIIQLENGQEAFASFGGVRPGTKVFCTVLKKATERFRVFVSIDSVLYDEEESAA